MLQIRVGDQWRGIDTALVTEILDDSKPTPLPRTPDHVLGVLVFRGSAMPVVCMRQSLGVPSTPSSPLVFSRVVVVETDGMRIGWACDQVLDLGVPTPEESVPLDIHELIERVRVRG